MRDNGTNRGDRNRYRDGRDGVDSVTDERNGAATVADASGGGHARRDFVAALSGTALAAVGLGAGAAEQSRAAPDTLPTQTHIHRGHQDVIVLGIHFQDNTPPGSIEEYQAAMFDANSNLGYDEYTLPEYFDVVSDGRFSIGPGPEGFAGWYQVSQTSDDYELGDIVPEALDLAIADGFDITAYDQENPTQIVALVYTDGGGGGVAWVGHRLERQGVQILGFCEAPARASAAEQDINYTAHEYLHLVGLTDLYQDPGTDGMGVMGAGPLVNMIPWSKVNVDLERTPAKTGWDETTAIHPTDQAGILPPQSVENQFYTVVGEPNPAEDDPDFHEHYYLAYADGTGVDAPLEPHQEGLVVWHHYQSMWVDWGSENFQFATPSADGETFRATDSALDASLVETDVALDDVSTDYGTLQFNDPPHRSVPAGSRSVYAVDVDAGQPEWLPDLSDRERQRDGDVIYTDDVVDARVSWADDADDVSLTLYAPDGSRHAVSDDHETSFAVVRSDEIDGSELAGGWKLVEDAAGNGTLDYYRATNYPTAELATTTVIDDATLEDGTLTATVSLRFGDGSPYAYDRFGAPTAEQFAVAFDGSAVASDAVTVTEVTESTYDLAVDVGNPGDGEYSVSIGFVDRKAGVTHETDADEAAVTVSENGTGTDPDPETIDVGPYETQDTTDDGLHDDFDGDGETTHDDVTAFFEHLEDDAVRNNPEYFDFDDNGRIGFGDVVDLLRRI